MPPSKQSKPPGHGDVVLHGKKRLLDATFQVDEVEVTYPLYRGGLTKRTKFLVFERGNAASALVHNTQTNTILLAEQFRYPTYESGPGWLIEAAAGMIKQGETPEACIRREVREELGYEVDQLEPIGCFFASPGGSSERIYLYYAPVHTSALKNPNAGGRADEHEDIRRIEMSVAEFLDRARKGNFEDAKTIIAAQWLELKLASDELA